MFHYFEGFILCKWYAFTTQKELQNIVHDKNFYTKPYF